MGRYEKTGKISALLCGLLLIGISGIYGLPKAYVLYQANSGKVAIHLEEYRMNGEKEVPWETEENVLPGGLISKIPRIVNDGADCYVRAKIVFTSEETSDQPLSADNLEGIGSEWVQDGEYFYCKEVVKSGESVDFFRGIRLPAEWKESPEAENRWQASVRAEAVQAECFFPDFSVSDPWGMKTKQFVIRQAMEGEAEEQDGDKDQMELVIASDLQGFTMEQEGCMKQLETFMPGKSQSGKVVIRNGADHKREVFFRAEAPQMTPLLEKMELTVQVREKDQIQILYQGTVTETMLKQNQSLGEILPGKDKQVEFLFSLPEEADNVYAAQTGQVKFWFTTGAPQKTQIVKVAKTGDSQYPGYYLITGIAGAVLAVVVLGKESIRKKGIKSIVYTNRWVKQENIKEGDIIAYGLSGGVSVLHRVVETDKNSRIWRTKGDANEVSDPGAVSYEQYLGKMIFSLPYVGYLISVFKRRSIWLGTIAVGILLLILQQKETWKSGKEKTV